MHLNLKSLARQKYLQKHQHVTVENLLAVKNEGKKPKPNWAEKEATTTTTIITKNQKGDF